MHDRDFRERNEADKAGSEKLDRHRLFEDARVTDKKEPPVDRELILRCVRLEASVEEQEKLRRFTQLHKSWQDAFEAAYRAEDQRAERDGLTEEEQRFLNERLWEDAHLSPEERQAAFWKLVREKTGQ
jgi:hypothetical protein